MVRIVALAAMSVIQERPVWAVNVFRTAALEIPPISVL